MTSVALTSDENTALAGVSTRTTYLKQWPATSIATARVNGSLAYPIADIPTTSESGGWTSVKEGMTLLIGTAAGLADIARFRVRQDVAATGSIAVGDFGTNDAGSVSMLAYTAISNGNYLTVVNTRDIHAVFPRIVYNGGTSSSIYEDYELSNIISNLQPSPIVRIKTNNSVGGHYGVKVADGATVAITAVATVQHWPSSSTVLSYSWSYPAGFTGVSGASSATLTATAPIGNHEISCTVTPDYGAAITAVRYILICDDTTNPPISIASVDSDTRNKTVRRVSLGLNNTAVTSIPDGAGVIMWDQGTWNGSDVPTATTTFVGWLSQVGFSAGGGLRQGGPEIIGIGEVLNYLTNTSQLFEVTNVPTVWQQMAYSLATFNWVIWWLLTHRASNVLTLFNFYPYSVSSSVGRMPAFDIGAGSILGQVQSLAQRYRRGNVGSTSGGELYITIPAHMVETGSRGSLTTRLALTATKVSNVSWRRDLRPRVRQIDGQAFTWDGAAALPTPLKSIVPERPAQGSSDDTLGEQIVASQTELNAMTGLYYAWVNSPIQSVTLTIPKNFDVVEPAEGYLINVTIPAEYSPTGVEWQFDATPISVNKRYLQGGATEIELTVEPLTAGAAGASVPVPPPGENVLPSLPPIDEIFPIEPIIDWGPELTIDPGNPTPLDPLPNAPSEYPDIYGATSEGHVWKATNGTFTDISPTTAQLTAMSAAVEMAQDAWKYARLFLIGSQGILKTEDKNASTVVWTSLTNPSVAATWDENLDLTAADAGMTAVSGTYVGGSGWTTEYIVNTGGYRVLDVSLTLPSSTRLTRVVMEFTYSSGSRQTGTAEESASAYLNNYGTQIFGISLDNIPTSPQDHIFSEVTSTSVEFHLIAGLNADGSDPGGTAVLTAVHLYGKGYNPFDTPLDDETIIGAFQCYLNKEHAYCWLSKRNISSVDYVYFNRTFDDFTTITRVQVATWATNMLYSICISPHNWRFVYCTAGNPGGSDAYVYKSVDGGGAFTATSVGLYTHGGQLWWNWSTSAANTPNTSNANILIVRGLNGSNNLLIRRGLTGSDITIANGSGKYGLQVLSLYQLPRDADFVVYGMQDNTVYKSSNQAVSFSAATSVTGGSSNVLCGLWRWPTDSAFGLLHGYRTLAYTTNTYSSYTSMWSTFDVFRSATYGSDGETIISSLIDLGQHYIRPVASEA